MGAQFSPCCVPCSSFSRKHGHRGCSFAHHFAHTFNPSQAQFTQSGQIIKNDNISPTWISLSIGSHFPSKKNNLLFFSAIFQSPCACAAERLKRRPKPWIKKTFGGSSQNRYTFSICATLPSISSVNLVHFRFVVHFTDLCKRKNDGPDRQRKHHNCKKGPETPKKP